MFLWEMAPGGVSGSLHVSLPPFSRDFKRGQRGPTFKSACHERHLLQILVAVPFVGQKWGSVAEVMRG